MICCCGGRTSIGVVVYTCTGVTNAATATCTGPRSTNIPIGGPAFGGQTDLSFVPTDGYGDYTIAISAPGHYSRTIVYHYTSTSARSFTV